LVASAKQPAGVPHRIAALCPDRLAFRLVDRFDYIALGCDRELRSPAPGRALRSSDGLEIQVAKPPSDFPPTARDHRPPPVQRLPTRIDQASIGAASHVDGAWSVPVGLCDRSRLPGTIALGAGRHGLVAGPARSGRSSVLRLVARLVTQAGGRVGVIADPRSAVSMVEGADVLEGEVGDAHLAHLDVVVVDDADGIDAGWLLDAIADRGLACGVLAAGETMALVRGYGHWTERIRRERSGLLLAPEPSDGDLLRVRLRRTQLGRPVPGRGVLVGPDGIDVIQTALPAD